MKFKTPLDDVFATVSQIVILRFLTHRQVPMSGRHIARETGLHPKSAFQALNRLERLELVTCIRGGRDHLFALNRKHWIVEKILRHLFVEELKFSTDIKRMLQKKLCGNVRSLILFGSMARSEEREGSDLDICIVVNNSKEKNTISEIISKLISDFSVKFGVQLSPIYLTVPDLIRRYKRKNQLVMAMKEEGIVLAGDSITNMVDNGNN